MLKTVSSIVNAIGALNYKGTWNASTNTPTLASGVGTKGDYYVVSVAGSTTLDGISNWGVGDWATYNGSVWQRVEGGAELNGTTLSVSGTSTLTGGIVGTTTNNNAAVGIVGEYVNSTVNVVSAVALTTATGTNITSISLTAGDWDVWARLGVVNTTAATWTYVYGVISTTSASFSNQDYFVDKPDGVSVALANFQAVVPQQRISLASTTTIYLVCSPGFTGGTGVAGFGAISARRIR